MSLYVDNSTTWNKSVSIERTFVWSEIINIDYVDKKHVI